jgi:multisubunit Na+/H+ antiporter MnhF subunit
MPNSKEITEICKEFAEFKAALQNQEVDCGGLESRPEFILFSIFLMMKRQDRSQRYATVCSVWIAIVLVVVSILLFSSNPINLGIALIAMVLALVPTYIFARNLD